VSLPKRIPWTLVVFLIAALIPVLGSRYYTFLATDIVIFAMFATSLNLLLGVTGLVPFGHAAYFGVGAYVCAIFMKDLGLPFLLAWLLGGGDGHPGYDGAFALDAAAQLEAGRASSYAASALAPVAHPARWPSRSGRLCSAPGS